MQRFTHAGVLVVGLSTALCGILVTPAVAQTQEADPEPVSPDEPEPWTRQISVDGQIGYGTPLGVFGVAVDADILPWLSISAGLGTDLFETKYTSVCACRQGLRQLALMPRLRIPIFDRSTFVTLGVGVSRDPSPGLDDPNLALVRQDDELGLEHRFQNGVRARAFAGIGFALNDPSLPAFGGTAYFGASLGYAVLPNPDHSSAPPGRWYGYQLLLSDAVAAIVAGEAHGSQQAYRGAFAIFSLTPAIIHVAHHQYGAAALSAAMRLGLPFLALQVNDGSPGSDYDVRGSGVLVAAMVAAVLVDELALSWKD